MRSGTPNKAALVGAPIVILARPINIPSRPTNQSSELRSCTNDLSGNQPDNKRTVLPGLPDTATWVIFAATVDDGSLILTFSPRRSMFRSANIANLRLRISCRRVVVMRAPVHPMGWPKAMAPPLTLSLS